MKISMPLRSRLLSAVLCALASPALAVIPIGLSENLTLSHDGEVRAYDVLRPPSSQGQGAAPLVVDLHGYTSGKTQQRGISGWQALAEAEGFLVAWPDGLENSWNGGTCCGSAVTNDVDDVGFIRAVVAAVRAEAFVDPGRVYVTGLSNGGAMTQRLACEAADLFAAAAPLAFPVPYQDFTNECAPARPIPVLTFMGFTDVLVPYSGAAPSFAGWRDVIGCDAGGAPPEVNEVYGGSDCAIDTSCGATGVRVGLCSVTGSALDPPFDAFSGHILYINDDQFDVTQRAWDFMSVYRSVPLVPVGGGALLLGGALAGSAICSLVLGARRR